MIRQPLRMLQGQQVLAQEQEALPLRRKCVAASGNGDQRGFRMQLFRLRLVLAGIRFYQGIARGCDGGAISFA